LHVKVHLVATAVVAVVNPIPHAPASTVWRAVAVGVLVAMAAAVVVVTAAALAVVVDAEAAAVAAMAAVAAAAVRLVADQPCISNTSEVQPYFFSN
jgi:hypothetical protein